MKYNQLPALLAIVMLASCGSGGGSKTASSAESTPIPVQAAKVALSIIIPQAAADEAPEGTTYTVKVSGKAAATKEIPAGKCTRTSLRLLCTFRISCQR